MYRKPKYSFAQWCIDNGKSDLLDRWDYDLNNCNPSDVSAKTEKELWFKCPCNKHESELKRVDGLAYGKAKDIHCIKCDSFAQGIIDEYGVEYLNKIWSDKNEFTPWDISNKNAHKNIIFRCLKNPAHEFERTPQVYWRTSLCPICEKEQSRFGTKYPESVDVWSQLNDTSPFDYSTTQHAVVWWKCNNGVHDDYRLSLQSMVDCGFQCYYCKPKKWYPKYGNRLDLSGKRFGKLTVLSIHGSINNITYWNCKCDCGNECVKIGYLLYQGRTKTCGDRTIHFVGEDNPNWKGGITPENIAIRMSSEYDEWRLSVYEKDGYSCQICGTHDDLTAHHIYPFATYPDLRLDINNGMTLCNTHHSTKSPESFHSVYGCFNNTPEQLEEYINEKRKQLGIDIPFSIDEYVSGNNKLVPTNNFNKYIVINQENRLCSISIPLLDAELIWSQNTKEE